MKRFVLLLTCAVAIAPLRAATEPAGRFESLGIPVRVGGLMGRTASPNAELWRYAFPKAVAGGEPGPSHR